MRLNWKISLLAMFVALGTSGCGGISASKSVSPLDFLLPGIIKVNAPATNAPVVFLPSSNNLAFVK